MFPFFGPPRNILSPHPWSRTCGAGSGSGEWCNGTRNWCAGYCGAKLSLWFVPLLSYRTRPHLPEQEKHGGNGTQIFRLCDGACRVRLATQENISNFDLQPSSHWRFQYMHWINPARAADTVTMVRLRWNRVTFDSRCGCRRRARAGAWQIIPGSSWIVPADWVQWPFPTMQMLNCGESRGSRSVFECAGSGDR